MFASRFCKTSGLSLTYCRQHYLKIQNKRGYCVKTAAKEGATAVTDREHASETSKRKGNVTIVSKNAQNVILDFFNNCDNVTLNKLTKYKKKRFRGYNYQQVYENPSSLLRYSNLDDFILKTGIAYDRVEDMAALIQQLEKSENSKSEMKFLHPKFDRVNIADIDKVVALDVFQGKVAWCVRSTEDDYILDTGFTDLQLNASYDHVEHHKQMRMFLGRIPESEVYLVRSDYSTGGRVSKKASRFHLNQAVMEALILTILNERHLPDVFPGDQAEEMSSRTRFLNKVHLFHPLVLQEFYDISFKGELLPMANIFKTWFNEKHPNVIHWGLDREERKPLFYMAGAAQVSVCCLITDMFCRYLRKRYKQFPHAYT